MTVKPANLPLTAFITSAEQDIGSWYLKDAKEAGYESDSVDAFPMMKDNMEYFKPIVLVPRLLITDLYVI